MVIISLVWQGPLENIIVIGAMKLKKVSLLVCWVINLNLENQK